MKFFRFSPSRLALSYIALSMIALALFAVPLWYAWRVNISTFRAYVNAEDTQRMLDVFHSGGAAGLTAAIDRLLPHLPRDEIMIFADPAKLRLAGNLPRWPAEVPEAPGTYGLELDLGGSSMRVVASHASLPGGYHLLVGRESARFQSLTDLFWYGIFGATAILVILGAIVGWLSRRSLLAEVQAISASAAAVVNGDLTRRVAVGRASSELDTLSQTVNGMLERLASQQEQSLARAFEEMQALKGQFQLAIDTIPGLVWSALPDGYIDFLNQRWREYTGLSLAEASGWGWQIAIHRDDLAGLVEYWKAVLASGKPGEIEARLRKHDGSYRWFLFRGVPLYDDAGRLVKWYGTNTDLEDRKQAEALVAGERNLLEKIAKGGPLAEVLDTACRLIEAMAPGSLCTALLIDADARLRHAAAPSLPREYTTALDGRKVELALGPCAMAVSLSEAVVVADIQAEARWPEYRALTAKHGLRSCTSLPILSSEGRVLGTLAALSREPGDPPPQLRAIMEQFTRLASIAVERAHTEQELKRSEQSYALAMEAARDGHWDWIVETDRFYASPRMLEIYGFAPDTVFAGRADFLARFPFHPEDKPKWEEAAAAHFAGRTARFDLELRMIRHGEVRWIQLSGLCLRHASGAPVRWTGSVSDITERKCAEAALRESEERFMLAVAGANDGIWDWDVATDQMFLSERTQHILDLAPGAAVRARAEWRAMMRMDPDDAQCSFRSIDEHVTGSSATYDEEWRVRDSDDTLHWIRVRGVCLRDASGHAYRMAGSIEDITDRKAAEDELLRLERQLRQSQRLEGMGTLAGGIAHDFNNILGAILGYGEMALRDVPASGRLRRDLDSIVAAGERGRALVDRILAFSRSAVGERVPVQVQKVVEEALDLVAAKLPPGVEVETNLDAGSAALLGDETQVHQVLMNLATNAVQAMPNGGSVRVALATAQLESSGTVTIGSLAPGSYIVLSVADSGTGIAPDVVDRIFDPFFTTKEVGVGTGLGLSLVHGIVTQLGGSINVASMPGKGSVFTVYFPRSADVAAGPVAETPNLPRGAGERVLIIDDEEALVALAQRTLQELGYVPAAFVSPAAALDAFRAEPMRFDVVITDERMPGMSGAALIREIRAVRRSIPILLVSGYLGGMVSSRAYNAGATEVLKKPLSARDLAVTLARALRPE
jgi:PAS domain S-box-containing protein